MTARSQTAPRRVMVAFRCDEEQRDQLNAKAAQYKMTLTDFLLAAAFGQLPEELNENRSRFEDIEQRLSRLESLAY